MGDLVIITEEWKDKLSSCIIEKLGNVKVLFASKEQFYKLPFHLVFLGSIPAYFIKKENIYKMAV